MSKVKFKTPRHLFKYSDQFWTPRNNKTSNIFLKQHWKEGLTTGFTYSFIAPFLNVSLWEFSDYVCFVFMFFTIHVSTVSTKLSEEIKFVKEKPLNFWNIMTKWNTFSLLPAMQFSSVQQTLTWPCANHWALKDG